MTIAICLKVGDGVVLGTDSAASLIGENDRYFNVYNNAEKTINLVKGLPIGLMTYGLGGLAGLSIGSLARDLRQRLSGEDPAHPEWALDPSGYTVEEVAQRVRDFFYDGLYAPEFGNPMAHGPDAAEPGSPGGEWDGEGGAPGAEAPEFPTLGFVVAGLSANSYHSEVWTVTIEADGRCTGPEQRFGQRESGVADFWGMPEAVPAGIWLVARSTPPRGECGYRTGSGGSAPRFANGARPPRHAVAGRDRPCRVSGRGNGRVCTVQAGGTGGGSTHRHRGGHPAPGIQVGRPQALFHSGPQPSGRRGYRSKQPGHGSEMSESKSDAPPRPAPVPPRGGSKPPIPPPPRLTPAEIKKIEDWAARYGAAPIRKFR